MPYPAQITPEAVVNKARELIEAEGYDGLSLSRLAAALDVKAPSLYRHFDGKSVLLRAINEATSRELVAAIRAETDAIAKARERVLAIARSYRAFARAYPATYGLLFATVSPEAQPDAEISERLVLPLQAAMAELSGEREALAALRGLMALVHGYTALELNGQFRRGGDLEATFTRIVEAYIDGWTSSSR